MSRPWLLSRRITLAFGLTTLVLSLLLSLPFAVLVHRSVGEEIDALAREELEETRVHFSDHAPDEAEFAEITAEMCRLHPRNPLAWRVWRPDGERWGDFGREELFAHAPLQRPLELGLVALGHSMRLGVVPMAGGYTAALVLDAGDQSARLAQFLLAALGFALLATVVATLAGGLLARRVARMLETVAECARTEQAAERWPAPGQAPAEIQAVVQALQDTLRRIREESEGARLLISGTAHELRSPLQNLMGETQVTLLREREAAEYRRVLESHLEELGELSRMVDNLVTLSSLGEARRRPTLENFDLAQEARLRLERELAFARRRGVEFQLQAEGPLLVEGDRESLLLALRNVVTNAIEWSPSGKRVELSMRARAEDLEIVVDDAGPGVPAAERENIFRPFQRSSAARGRRVGFGLGLALTHSVVTAQGGTIEVGDSPLGGARFRILIPAKRAG
ncbi:MAG: hypothetical protein HOP15_00760 [Planctomycetes bacterium]|nr:hypothetical protein [Planctomycetota bacterium]